MKFPLYLKKEITFFRTFILRFWAYYFRSRLWTFFHGLNLSQTPVFIVGMHRSGTSLVAGMLNKSGMSVGRMKSMRKADIDNPRGYFENPIVNTINIILLHHFSLDWKSIQSLPDSWENSSFAEKLIPKTRYILNREFFGEKIWGCKDPRSCLTLKFWEKLFPDMKLVVTERDRKEIAISLNKRKERPEDSDKLINHYFLSLENNLEGKRYKKISYAKIISKDEAEIKGLLEYIGLDPGNYRKACDFISPDLYRSKVKSGN